MIVVVIVWTLAFGIGAIFLCKAHPTFAWAPVIVVAEKCSAQLPFLKGYAISDFIMDVLIWTLPIPKVSIVCNSFGSYATIDLKIDLGFEHDYTPKTGRTASFPRRSFVRNTPRYV